jgi:hypothetical protein
VDRPAHVLAPGRSAALRRTSRPGAKPYAVKPTINAGCTVSDVDVRALLPTIRVPTLVVQHTDDQFIPPAQGKYVADHISGAKYVELPGRNMFHFVEPWRESFQEIYEFLTGHQAEVADDRVLATVLFTDIVDSTRRAAEMGDRDWHALLDAHDAVVRVQLNRFRGREVNTSGDVLDTERDQHRFRAHGKLDLPPNLGRGVGVAAEDQDHDA